MATVVIPVWGPSPDLQRCLDSVLGATDLSVHEVVVVGDGPLDPGPAEVVARATAARTGGVRLLATPRRRGFPAAANSGLALAPGDAVILNSDTEVAEGWLERLAEAARRRPRTASVTPFSNDATLCSLPRPFAANALPAGHSVASFAKLVSERSARIAPEIPTGVGFCLYVTRAALDEVGPFEEGAFGDGYGEEVDWCLLAAARGFVHVLDDATFVWHRGGGSFGPERRRRERAAERLLARRHPGFLPRLARFMRQDPLATVRERVLDGLRPPGRGGSRGPGRVAHLVHGWPPFAIGGTEIFARTLALAQAGRREVAVYGRLSDPSRPKGHAVELVDHGVRVRLVVNDFLQRDPLSRNALHDAAFCADFDRFLEETRPDVLHVHHLAGHAATLPERARRRGIPIVVQLQDWWPLCARVNLLRAGGEPCEGPSPLVCARCRTLTALPPRPITNAALHLVRAGLMRRALRAERYVAGSRFLVDSWTAAGWLPASAGVDVVPYGVAPPVPRPPEREGVPGRPLRFGFVGALMPHKGAHVAVEAFRGVPPDVACLRIHGSATSDPEYARGLAARVAGAAVTVEGAFPDEEKARVFSDLDVLVVPSIGLESYGIVVDEAMSCGVPVVASRSGALTERYDETCGAFVPPGDAAALRDVVLRLASRRETVAHWRRALPRVRSMEEAALRIEEIYAALVPRGSVS